MRSKASIKSHPIHPMLICVPLGLWVFSFVGDILYLTHVAEVWKIVSAYAMIGGVVGAVAAAIPGFIDYLDLWDPVKKKIATWHMVLNLCAVVLYTVNFMIRYSQDYEVEGLPFFLSILTIVFISISGWLGGELVYIHKVSVAEHE